MSLSQLLAPHLPYLRRFARALTGNQKAGDAYVAATLEAIIDDPGIIDKEGNARCELFRVFLKIWNSLDVNIKERAEFAEEEGERKASLEKMTPPSRQAFLLSTVEGFSLQEIATILDKSQEEVSRLIHQVGMEIAEQVRTRVLIIEDEPIIAMDIENLVQDMGHEVIGVARTHKEAARLAQQETPGIILADIKLADGSNGIDAVNEILDNIEVPVVFITAYPEQLLTGSKPEPVYLITKPFQPEMVKAVMSQALFFDEKARKGDAAAA